MSVNSGILRWRFLAMGCSALLILTGFVLFFVLGFNTGIDFGSGYSERIQIAPLGFTACYEGEGTAQLSVSDGTLELTKRDGSNVETYSFPASEYPLTDDIASALESLGVETVLYSSEKTGNLVSGFGFPALLSSTPFRVNFSTDTVNVTIEDIREALTELGSVNVQTVGSEEDGIYQIRVTVEEGENQNDAETRINTLLSAAFGAENLVVLQSTFVGPKFSSSLFHDSLLALGLALVLILCYVAIRFRFAYAISSILALLHDVLAMLSFVLIFRLEVSATTIAAVLTIIGYSINNTIVIFDRVRENIKIEKANGLSVDEIISLSVRQSLTRTVMTSLTTLVAIVPLAILGSGDIQIFAVNLTWGIIAGAYSSNFLAPAFLHYFHALIPIDKEKEKKEEEEYSLV